MTSHDSASAVMNGTTASVQDQQVVLCELAGELYGIDIARVEEIIRLPEITRVPRAPRSIEGGGTTQATSVQRCQCGSLRASGNGTGSDHGRV